MALLPFLALLAADSQAGNRTISKDGVPLSWQTDVVPYWIDPSGKHGLDLDEAIEFVQRGAEQWAAEGSWVTLEYQGEREVSDASFNDYNEVFFADTWVIPGDAYPRDPSLLALTYVWSTGGEILEFDIAVNSDLHDWTVSGEEGRNDLWNAMTHEFGHALGFDHSDDDEATMYWSTSPGDTDKRDLAKDDMDLFASVYGGSFPFTEVGQLGCSAAGGAPAGFAVLAGLLGLVGRRRRNDEEEA